MNHEPGIYFGLEAEIYHRGLRDDVRVMSSTFAKKMLKTSPYEARFEERKDSPAFAIGRAIHELTLEGEYKTIVPCDISDWRGKEARELKTSIEADGKTAMKLAELESVEAIAAAVRNHRIAGDLLSEGAPEVSALVEDDGLWEQARFDWLRTDGKRPVIIDLKTVAGTANPRDFNRTVATFGYHIQAAMYADVLQRALGLDVMPIYYWIVVSKEKPYAVSVAKASDLTMQTGFLLYAKAREVFRECIETGEWAGYDEITESELPVWAEYEAEEISGKELRTELIL